MESIRWFSEIDKNDVLLAGGKGANLGEMTQAGLPVPQGFCVTVSAYQAFLEKTDLSIAIRDEFHEINPENLAQISSMAANIRRMIESQPFPELIADPILAAYEAFGIDEVPVAVRSSATAEDLEDASFAGQHDTYLNVRGEAALLDHVRKCWASLWTDRAVTYRTNNGIDHLNVFVSVVVQAMVNAEISGIMFTAHPQTLNQRKVFIEFAWGLGEAIVSGLVTPDEYLVEKLGHHICSQKLGEKAMMIVYDGRDGTLEKEVSIQRREMYTLNDTHIQELVSLANIIEHHYGRPMDTEWAYRDGELYLLQARPITTESIRPPGEFNRSMFIDIFPDPLSPIFLSVISPLFNGMLDFTFEKMGFPPPTHIKGTGEYYNQVYFNRDYIAETFKPLSKKVRDPIVASLVNPFGHHEETSAGELTTPYLRMLTRVLSFMVQFPKILPGILKRYQADIAAIEAVNIDRTSDAELVSNIQRLVFESVNHLLNYDFLLIMVIGRSYRILGSLLRKYYGEETEEIVAQLISGVTGNVTMETNIHLWDLSRVAMESPKVEALIRAHPPEEVISKLKLIDEGRPFLAALESFLAEYGHREVKMSILYPTWSEDPVPVLTFIRMYLDADEALSPHKQQERLILERETLTQDVLASVKDDMTGRFILTPILRWMLNQSQLLTRERDTMHFEMTRLFPPFRVFLLELGSRWAARGLIEQNEDIFFLEIEELEELADRPRVVRELVQQRRREFDLNEEQGSPTIILEGEPIYPERSAEQDEDPNVLRGISGSPGQIEGVARIIRGPEEFSKLQRGEILIAPSHKPGLDSVICDRERCCHRDWGDFSHGAIVAREIRHPCSDVCGRRNSPADGWPDNHRRRQQGGSLYPRNGRGVMNTIGLAIACYLIGSIPIAWIIAKLVTGGDLRMMGSGNVGVMNVALSVARWAGLLVFLGEASKGIIAVSLAQAAGGAEIDLGVAVVAAVVGTRWPIWLRGEGGRGNTAGAAAMLIISWQAVVVGLGTWFVARLITRSSFIATRVLLILIPVLLGLSLQSWWFVLFGLVLGTVYLKYPGNRH